MNDKKLYDELSKITDKVLNFGKTIKSGRTSDKIFALQMCAYKLLDCINPLILPDVFDENRIERNMTEVSEYLNEFGYKIIKIEEKE